MSDLYPEAYSDSYPETYRVRLKKTDPKIQLQLPLQMLEDLKQRAHENGRNLNIEIMVRLTRTLENDYHRDEFDRVFEKIFFINDEKHA